VPTLASWKPREVSCFLLANHGLEQFDGLAVQAREFLGLPVEETGPPYVAPVAPVLRKEGRPAPFIEGFLDAVYGVAETYFIHTK